MHRLRAVAVLLLVATAWAPLVHGGSADDPELEDPAGDHVVTRPADQSPFPVPGVNDETFDDVDIVAAWFEERGLDCGGAAPSTCPAIDLVVATSAGWLDGTLTASFNLEKGPTSLAASTAAGQAFNLTVQGTTVTGIANATADATADGLRIRFPRAALGAVGGDLLTGLALNATRTDSGTFQLFTQDDQAGSDAAGPGAAYTVFRPTPVALVDVGIVQVGNRTGSSLTTPQRGTYDVIVRISNLGTDPDAYTLTVTSDPPLQDRPALPAPSTPLAGDTQVTVPISVDGMKAGPIRITFTVTTQRGATDSAVATIDFAPAAADRAVVPAGLDFLTPAAESAGLDAAFGKYAELVLLALIVLLVILVVFLLVALAPSTLAGSGAPEAPPVKAAETAPEGLLPVVAPDDEPSPDTPADGAQSAAAAPAGAALNIESVTHDPEAPEEGEEVTTEVVLRNSGPTRQVRVVLAADDLDRDEAAATLPARATKTVRLSWTAGPGENRVRVRVLPA